MSGAGADQAALKEAALAAQQTIKDLADASKLGAGALSLDDVETQVQESDLGVCLLNSC